MSAVAGGRPPGAPRAADAPVGCGVPGARAGEVRGGGVWAGPGCVGGAGGEWFEGREGERGVGGSEVCEGRGV